MERLARWRHAVSGSDPVLFDRHLKWLGLDQAAALQALDTHAPVPTPPKWTDTLLELHQMALAFHDVDKRPPIDNPLTDSNGTLGVALDPDEPLPFESLWVPAIAVARQRLSSALAPLRAQFGGDLSSLITPQAYLSAERSLLRRLTSISGKPLGLEFAAFRPAHFDLPFSLPWLEPDPPPPRDDWYLRFIALYLDKGLATLFDTYPVLARLIVTAIENWTDELTEFLLRLAADRETLYREAGPVGHPAAAAVHLSQELSDVHLNGRSVRIVRFADGWSVVYKPRSVMPEVVFNQLLVACNKMGAAPAHATIRHLDRGAYGWALSCVKAQPCCDRAAVERFYQRAGMLLCLAYVLDMNDLHSENLIAAGEHPVLVDTETLMHPRVAAGTHDVFGALDEDARAFADSVLRSGLLPRWSFDAEARNAYDVSGLGRSANQQAPWRTLCWTAINTDRMALEPRDVLLAAHGNVPILNGEPVAPADYVEAISAGFATQYRLLIQHRAALLDDATWIETLKRTPVRFLLRPTEVYGAIIEQAGLPQHLHDGVDRSFEIDRLSSPFLASVQPGPLWSTLAAERTALEQLDIPYFGTTGGSRALEAGVPVPVPDIFDVTGVERMVDRLQRLDEHDLARQIALLRGSFLASTARLGQATAASTASTDASACDAARLTALAGSIADDIARQALRDSHGRVAWPGLRYVAQARRFQFEPVGVNLYDGRCGIALFLAASAYVAGNETHQSLLADTLAPIRRLFDDSQPADRRPTIRRLGIGGASGLGSIVYALTRIAGWVSDPTLLDTAAIAARWIADGLDDDDRLDVIDGAAGALLGLLTLYSATRDHTVLDTALACGDRLSARQIVHRNYPPAWQTLGPVPLTGFSHGAAGIAYALLRLHAASGRPAYRAAALNGIAYERARYDIHRGNWPDFRLSDIEPGFGQSWCHGAPGVGLARIGCLDFAGDEAGDESKAVGGEIDAAVAATRAAGLQPVDHLCCGVFGSVDALLSAGLRLGRDDVLEAAQQLTAQAIARAEREGGFRLFGNLPVTTRNPTLFQGTAGIGYELLRLAAPAQLPSVLLFH